MPSRPTPTATPPAGQRRGFALGPPSARLFMGDVPRCPGVGDTGYLFDGGMVCDVHREMEIEFQIVDQAGTALAYFTQQPVS